MTKVQELAAQLFRRFQTILPLIPQRKAQKIPPKKVQEQLERFYAEARAQREEQRLGLIGKARVVFCLQQHMMDAGYPPELVRKVLFSLLLSSFVGR